MFEWGVGRGGRENTHIASHKKGAEKTLSKLGEVEMKEKREKSNLPPPFYILYFFIL